MMLRKHGTYYCCLAITPTLLHMALLDLFVLIFRRGVLEKIKIKKRKAGF